MRCLIQNLALSVVLGVVAGASYGAETIRWETDLQTAFRQAQATNRPLLLHFWTTDCLPCKRLEHTVFNQPRVADAMQDYFIPVKIDANQFPDLAARYGVRSVPKDVIVTPDNEELHRMLSPNDPDQYVAQLSAVAFRAGSTKVPRQASERPESASFADRSSGLGRSPNDGGLGASGNRYDTDSDFSRTNAFASTSLPEYDGADAYRSDRSAPPEEQPREVINRYARRAGDDGPRTSPPVAKAPSRDEQAITGSQWGTWPRQAAAGQTSDAGADDVAPPVGGTAGRYSASRYAADRDVDPAGRSSTPLVNRESPAGQENVNPPLGLDGYCTVSLIRKNSWTKGDPRYGVIHRGRTYLFAGPEEKELFFADPDEYSPVLAGIDPVQLATAGETVLGERAHGVVYRKRVYLFSSEASLQQFWEEPERYASPIRQAMETGDVNRLFR